MKTAWILFALALLLIIGVGLWKKTNIPAKNNASGIAVTAADNHLAGGLIKPASTGNRPAIASRSIIKQHPGQLPANVLRDSLVQFALQQQGLPYLTAGTEPTGFDCSGFVHFAFAQFGIAVPHSSKLLAQEGVYLPKEQARKADLVIFKGTNPADPTPGHVGIVISNPHEPLAFVHSSSNGGVKVSTVDSTGYAKRFLQVRRLL